MTDSPQWTRRIRSARKSRLWDVHTMARQLRVAAGDDGRDLPNHEGLVRSIRRWESGRIRFLSERYRLLFCQSLEMDEEVLFAAADTPTAGNITDSLGTRHPPVSFEPPDSLDATQYGLHAMVAFRGADRQVGGGHLYATVLRYLEQDVAPRLFGGADGPAVFVAAAAFTEMAGWMAHDAGQDVTAARHFSRALDLASVGNDRQLEAHILGSLSHLAQQRGQAAEAVKLARQGTEMLANTRTSTPAMEARLLALAARGFASLGDSMKSAELLLRAEHTLEREPSSTVSPWSGPFDAGSLALDTARSMLALGQIGEARRQAGYAVALRPGNRTRSRALGQLLLAMALLEEGHLDGACEVATDVVEDTRSLGSAVVTRHLAQLYRRVQSYGGGQVVADFLTVLDEALTERHWLYQWGGSDHGVGDTAL